MPGRVRESPATYGSAPLRGSLHATVSRGESAYVAECWEVAVVTQGRTLDEVVANLREAVTLHLEGEDLAALGLERSPRLVVTYESPLANAPKAQTALGWRTSSPSSRASASRSWRREAAMPSSGG